MRRLPQNPTLGGLVILRASGCNALFAGLVLDGASFGKDAEGITGTAVTVTTSCGTRVSNNSSGTSVACCGWGIRGGHFAFHVERVPLGVPSGWQRKPRAFDRVGPQASQATPFTSSPPSSLCQRLPPASPPSASLAPRRLQLYPQHSACVSALPVPRAFWLLKLPIVSAVLQLLPFAPRHSFSAANVLLPEGPFLRSLVSHWNWARS